MDHPQPVGRARPCGSDTVTARGIAMTAPLFDGIHAPLALAGADTAAVLVVGLAVLLVSA